MDIKYYQLDLTNKKHEIEYVKQLQSKEFLIIGIEVTDYDFNQYIHFNIDPQHASKTTSITSLEFVFKYKDNIQNIINEFNNVVLITVKPDLDSIAAISILTMIITNDINITGDLILRLKSIIRSDKHGRPDWDNNKYNKEDILKFPSYSTFGLPIGLLSMIGDIKVNIDLKIKLMTQYLKTGNFNSLIKYNKKAKKKLKNASKDTSVKIIIPNKFVFVASTYRGAIGYGYSYAPIVLGKNIHYSFGITNAKIGVKYTIAQFNDSFIDLNSVKNELNKLEPGWGGSNSIIGSNQSKPSDLNEIQIINILKKQITCQN